VRAQLLGEAYHNDSRYKNTLEQIGHNGSTYGELGSDAAKQVLRCWCMRRRLEEKLPAGNYDGEVLGGDQMQGGETAQ
jgi:hypothetical protein